MINIFLTILIASMDWMSVVPAVYTKLIFCFTFIFLFLKNKVINSSVFFMFSYLLLHLAFFSSNSIDHLQTIAYMFIICSVFYYLLRFYETRKIGEIIISLSFYYSVFAILQELLFLINPSWILFHNLKTDNPDIWLYFNINILRVQSIFNEPSHFATFLLPSVYIGIRKLFFKDNNLITFKQFGVILIAFFCTISVSGLMGIIFIAIHTLYVQLKNKYYFIIFSSITFSVLFFVATNIPDLKDKLISTFDINYVIKTNKPSSGTTIYVGMINIKNSFFPYFFDGRGFENYIDASQEAAKNELSKIPFFVKGAKDNGESFGHARIIVEFGWVGFFLFLLFLYFNLIKKNESKNYTAESIIVNHSSFLYIILLLFRFGQFTYCALWFFISVFLLSHRLDMIIKPQLDRKPF